MNTQKKQKQKTLEKEYNLLMKDYVNQPFNIFGGQEWKGNNDFFVKFSLYEQSNGTITTTETTAIINL